MSTTLLSSFLMLGLIVEAAALMLMHLRDLLRLVLSCIDRVVLRRSEQIIL